MSDVFMVRVNAWY